LRKRKRVGALDDEKGIVKAMLERQLDYKADLERAMLQKGFKVFESDASLHNLDDMMQLASPHTTQRYLGQDPSPCAVFHRSLFFTWFAYSLSLFTVAVGEKLSRKSSIQSLTLRPSRHRDI
jgi:hypothetical protein